MGRQHPDDRVGLGENNLLRPAQQFIVETDGSISDVHVAKQVFPSLDAEAIRVVQAMPKWTPGKEKGNVVRVKYNLPIVFRM